jgi:hypothetical protein
MSVAELIGILERRCLNFRQLRSLRRDDRAEGSIPEDLYARDPVLGGDITARLQGMRANEDLSYCTYIQCWHRATREHSAFWRIYGDRGVAVRSRISSLRAQALWKSFSLRAEDIVYADTWAEAEAKGLAVPQGITPNRSSMRRKRRAFSWEKEWRIFYSPPTARYGALDATMPRDKYEIARREWQIKWPEYEEISIDSVKWISKLIIAPASPRWVFESICSIAKRHNVDCEPSRI